MFFCLFCQSETEDDSQYRTVMWFRHEMSVLLLLTEFDYPFGIFNLFLSKLKKGFILSVKSQSLKYHNDIIDI
jgi:hypothetical protein